MSLIAAQRKNGIPVWSNDPGFEPRPHRRAFLYEDLDNPFFGSRDHAAILVEQYQNPPNDWQASPLDDPARPENEWWWLRTKWLSHRNKVVDVHPILLQLLNTHGQKHMTNRNVIAVLDAKLPQAAAAEQEAADVKRCAWRDADGKKCRRELQGGHGRKFCPAHARMRRLQAKRLSRQRDKLAKSSQFLATTALQPTKTR